ncbi:CDP-glycerol glycerophosphotransferase family protein [Bacillus sp. N9]
MVEKIKHQYKEKIKNNVVILFAPTYRAEEGQKESDINFIEILIGISKKMEDNKVIVYKPHPYLLGESLGALDDYENIIVAEQYSLNEWMLVSDALITDYSSSIFEYAILERPMAHFVPDLDEYLANRGLYYPIEVISDGEIIRDVNHLLEWINERSFNEHLNTKRMMKFNFSNVGNASERITKHFLKSDEN